MSWEHYRIFGKVAELRSMRKASTVLTISPATVLRAINDLEKMIDAPLFIRNKYGMNLTDYGRILYDRVRDMERIHNQTESEFSDLISIHKTLRVITTTGLAGSWMSQILPDFAQEYPSTNVNIIGYDDDFDKKLIASDIIIYPNYREYNWRKSEHLLTCTSRLFASQEYIKQNGLINSEEEMKDHKFISYGEEKYRPYKNIDWYIQRSKKPANFVFNNSYGALYLASKGMGVVSWPTPIPFTEGIDLEPVAPQIKGPDIEIYAAYNENSAKIKLIENFITFIKKKVGNYDQSRYGYNKKSNGSIIEPTDELHPIF